jgi:hypothetical protein
VLTRDIYRDFYKEESAPTISDRLFVAAKRICFLFAGAALSLGVLDVFGVHSIVGAKTALHDAPSRLASFGDTLRAGISSISVKASSMDSVRVAIPSQTAIRFSTRKEPTVVEELADVSKQDAVQLAMTSAQPTFPVNKASPAIAIERIKPEPKAIALSTAAPTSASEPLFSISEMAKKAQASLKPTPQMQLASLSPLADPAPAPVVRITPLASVDPAAPTNVESDVQPSATAPIALKDVVLPRPAPPIPPADRLGLKGAEYAKAERCLTNAIYFEARSESARGQMAVAQVVLNRVFSGVYPSDVCSVVYQNAHRRLACQFTFACDGKSKAITDRGSWARAARIARQTLDGQIYLPEVGKSTHYHATYVSPTWARTMHRLVRHGVHNFYRPYAWGRGDEKPIWGTAAIAQQVRLKQASATTTR